MSPTKYIVVNRIICYFNGIMTTFAERLKSSLEKLSMSQTELARRCGVSQQSINYIVNKNLHESKLAPQIADVLQLNLEWLMYGIGSPEEIAITQLPIIHSPYMLDKFLSGKLETSALDYTIINTKLDGDSFAYIDNMTTMYICTSSLPQDPEKDQPVLLFNKRSGVQLTSYLEASRSKKADNIFFVFEQRERYEGF